MNNYDFSTLNDKEFEQISKDLLNAKYKLELQDFKVGKDKGVDLRFSTPNNNNSIVVQVKHYIGSGFAQLKHTLLTKEYNKVKMLNPDRYIVVTSLPLNVLQKDELKDLLFPFVQTSNDIIGQEDLNGYLSDNNEIEKRYFKLWFSSITVFNTVLNNAIEGRTKYLLESIQKKIPFYVITKKLDVAIKILLKEKLLLITGQPGIGKTTLAEVILFDRAKNGYKIYKVENIREAEDVISPSDDDKQLFYFDDFLGANYNEIINAYKTETQLTGFVERVKNTPNKYLILTTRTVILNYAFEKYEKISHSKLGNQQFEIKLTDYDKYEKALILYNHIYFTHMLSDLHDSILNEKFYRQIIEHKNYTPRIIEFITDKSKIEKLSPGGYHQFILNNLNNPKEIWRFSFNNQIEYLDRCLLLTLFSFENKVFEPTLLATFERRLRYEKEEHNQVYETDQFNQSIKILLNGFLISTLYNFKEISIREFTFINPSLTDFLIGYVADSYLERKGIISSIVYVEQLKRFNPANSIIPLDEDLQIIIREKISKSELKILEAETKYFSNNKETAILLEVLSKYCSKVNVDALLLEKFKQLNFSENVRDIQQQIEYVLLNLGDAPQTFNYIKDNFIQIIEELMNVIDSPESAKKIPLLFKKYEQAFDEYNESDDGFQNLINLIETVLKTSEEDLKSERKDEIKEIDEVSSIYDDIHTFERELLNDLFPDTFIGYDFGIGIDEGYWKGIIEENTEKQARLDAINDDYNEDYFRDAISESVNEEKAIDDLFLKTE